MNSIKNIYLETLFYDLILSILNHKVKVLSRLLKLQELLLSLGVYLPDGSVLHKQTLCPSLLFHALRVYKFEVVLDV